MPVDKAGLPSAMTSTPNTTDADAEHAKVGAMVRNLRRRQNMTLQALGDAAGLSVGFLSQVERAIATPSLGALANIARALGVEISYFIASPAPETTYSRAGNREKYWVEESSLTYECMSAEFPGVTMSAYLITVPPHYESETTSHEGEDFIVQAKGRIRFNIENEEYLLNEGDSLHFLSIRPHRLTNPDDTPAQYSWVGTEPALLQRFKPKLVGGN